MWTHTSRAEEAAPARPQQRSRRRRPAGRRRIHASARPGSARCRLGALAARRGALQPDRPGALGRHRRRSGLHRCGRRLRVRARVIGTAAIWASQDGRTWQSVALLGEAATGIPRSITATPEGFVAVGSGCCPDRAAVWLSADGLAWERLPDQPAFADTSMLGVSWQDGGLVAVGCSARLECSSGLAWTSPDGRTWSEPVVLDMLPGDVSASTLGTFALGSSEVYDGAASLATSLDGTAWQPARRSRGAARSTLPSTCQGASSLPAAPRTHAMAGP